MNIIMARGWRYRKPARRWAAIGWAVIVATLLYLAWEIAR